MIWLALRQQAFPLSEFLNLLYSPKQRCALASQQTTRKGEPEEIRKPQGENTDKVGLELQLRIRFNFSL